MSEITAQLNTKIEETVGAARQKTNAALDGMKTLASEGVIQNGIRGQLDKIIRDLDGIDTALQKFLTEAHKSYGAAPTPAEPKEPEEAQNDE